MNPADDKQKPTAPVWGEWTPLRAAAPEGDKRKPLTTTQKLLISVVIAGALAVAIIGFTGSYASVSHLARAKGFGSFARVFPLGVDAGIIAVLALDLVLTGFRMRYAPLRPTAWVLTLATIAFNASAAWGDPVAVGMHAVMPFLFVIVVEAARHAIGIIANIEADRHMESPRLTRWLLAFPSTFRIWRRQRLWELRSYEDVIAIERDAAQYREALRAEHGRDWRKKAGPDALLALRLARYGTPVAETLARRETDRAAANERANQAPEPVPNQGAEPAVEPAPEPLANRGSEPAEPEVQDRPEPPKKTPRTSVRRTGRTKPRTGADQPNHQVREPAEPNDTPSPTEQVRQILNLIEEHGYDAVNLGFVMDHTGMKKTTAYNRLVEARATWSEDQG